MKVAPPTASMTRALRVARRRNEAADERDLRLDLLHSLRLSLSSEARAGLTTRIRGLCKAGHINRSTRRDLRILLGVA